MFPTLERYSRFGKLLACVIVGLVAAVRGASYIDPHGSTIGPVLLALFAVAISLTGVAMLGDEDPQSAE